MSQDSHLFTILGVHEMKSIKFDDQTISQIRKYAETHTKLECCNKFTITPKVMGRIAKTYNIWFATDERIQLDYVSQDRILIPDEMLVDGKGYVMCKKPSWYTGRKSAKYVYYHNIVMCENLGITEIPKGFMVRHLDNNKCNNDISNLILLTIQANSRLIDLNSE